MGIGGDVLQFARLAGWIVGVGTTTLISRIRPAIDGVTAEYIRVDLVWRGAKDRVENKSICTVPGHTLELAVFTQIGEGHTFLCNGVVAWVPGVIGG
ncbi:hypothetical protein D3C80_1750540 [compost metagenome]